MFCSNGPISIRCEVSANGTFVFVKPLKRLVSHLPVSRELSLKSSLTIDAARAGENVSRVQIDPTTISERTIPMRTLVLILCEVRIRPRSPDIATSLKRKQLIFVGASDECTGSKFWAIGSSVYALIVAK